MVNKRLLEIANRLGKYSPDLLPPASGEGNNQGSPAGFSLEDLTDSYRISGINYQNGIYQVDLSKSLLEAKTQDEHAQAAIESKKTNGFFFHSYPLFHSIASALEQNRNNPRFKEKIEEVRLFIKDAALKNWLTTSTRIIYNPKNEKDIVMHNYKQPEQYLLELDSFIGNDCFITSKDAVNVESPLKCLLDTSQSIQEINSVYKWLTDVNAYLYRVNSDRQEKDERVARFYAESDGVFLYCYGGPRGSNPALGVRYAPQARAAK
ncbi:hypothetical protein HYV89_01135 [Candidatus Woesearchaeota archaeon]|nr:hypothetical protein [Candidatus Woesearchaeota archaeon]